MGATDVPARPGAEALCVNVHVLVVEDDDAIAEPLVTGLRREGFAVRAVGTGEAAVAANGYDVALVDLGLPDIDGYEVCRQLRRDRPAMRLVAITGYSDARARSDASRAGFDGFLVKPVHPDLVEKTIREMAVSQQPT